MLANVVSIRGQARSYSKLLFAVQMINVGTISYALGALSFLALSVLLLTAWRGRLRGALLVAAAAMSLIWCSLEALHNALDIPLWEVRTISEVLRNAAWFAFLLNLLGYARRSSTESGSDLRAAAIGIGCLCIGFAAIVSALPHLDETIVSLGTQINITMFGYIALAVLGLALVEQLYRNTRPEHRWAIKFLCLGVGGIFAYDFFLYSTALLFKVVDPQLLVARGAINALVVPLIAVSAARNPDWSLEIFVSRHIVFHTAALFGAGSYLILMAGAGYYIRLYGGTWGGVAQAVFLFGSIVLLLLLLFSGQFRSKTKVFMGKHFFKNKYDYREEWLRFTHTLSMSEQNVELRQNAIRAIAEIVESPGGVIWMRRDTGRFEPIGQWSASVPSGASEGGKSGFVQFLEEHGWVVFLDEYASDPERYGALCLPDWMERFHHPWIVVPLMHRDELVGFIVLSRSSTKGSLNWEDRDLLKTVGRQAASYLALLSVDEALAESRQFEAFNRLSSYVVHDLKNLVAQLSLVSDNAKKHMNNPAFIADAMSTVENATGKMNRLLGHLRKDRLEETNTRLVNLKPVLRKIVQACSVREPTPVLGELPEGLIVRADPDRLAMVLEHVVQNAQEATPAHGQVSVRASRERDSVVIEVEDTGCGMDEAFVRERLFRPFDTTKGNAGMGIGVYESREFAAGSGGELEVASEPDKGTTFRIRLPSEYVEENPDVRPLQQAGIQS